MKAAAMQPYAFPYIGYFQLINYVDQWVVFDDTQYISKGWINRNRILHPDIEKKWQYFTIPVKKHSRESKIIDIEINDSGKWRNEFLGKLTSYKKKAPFYKETLEFISDCINYRCKYLTEWVIHTLESTCNYLRIPFQYLKFANMEIKTCRIKHAGQWALEIADAIGADEYVNPFGGYKIFREKDFLERKIKLNYLKPNLSSYVQRRGGFIPSLSIVDVMMWNNNDEIHHMLKDFEIITHSMLNGPDCL